MGDENQSVPCPFAASQRARMARNYPPSSQVAYRAVEIPPVPELEHQERPQSRRVIATPGHVLGDQAVDEPRLEVTTLPRARRRSTSAIQSLSWSAEPDRRAERQSPAFRRASISAGRSVAAACFNTCLRAPCLIFMSDGREAANVDDLVVEQRHARLDRVRHAHPIDLGEDVFGQVGLESKRIIWLAQAARAKPLEVRSRHAATAVRIDRLRRRSAASSARLSSGWKNRDRVQVAAARRRARRAAGSSCRARRAAVSGQIGAGDRAAGAAGQRSKLRDARMRAGSARSRRTARRRRRPRARP